MVTNRLHVRRKSAENLRAPAFGTRFIIIARSSDEPFAQFDSDKVAVVAIMEALIHSIVGRRPENSERIQCEPFAFHSTSGR
ncbi:MAG TPA: hypothetical protein VGX71_19215 [Pseudaminobacter sp.]|nr:hypothetical protein [Pseudaminobacter sp.]